MNYNQPLKNGSTVTIRVMCAIVFVVFSFAWLYFFQADLLMMTQHVLSDGLTQYSPLTGALLLTALLMVLQLVIYALFKLKKRSHALTYVPSMLMLALITDVSQRINGDDMHPWSWFTPVVVIFVWLLLVGLAKLLQEIEDDRDYGILSRPMWINMLLMSLQIMFVAWMGNTNAVFHYRMKVEGLLAEGRYEKALRVGQKSLESDRHLLMLRMYALARENALGERLFEYPITGTSADILPTNGRTAMTFSPVDSLWRFLGARPSQPMEPMYYLGLLESRNSTASSDSTASRTSVSPIADYRLCGLLIDRELDRFAREVQKYYQLDDRLPRHYREALVLYAHSRANPIVVYSHPVTEEDWRNLQELESQYPNATERRVKVEEHYRGTYWYYYEYER